MAPSRGFTAQFFLRASSRRAHALPRARRPAKSGGNRRGRRQTAHHAIGHQQQTVGRRFDQRRSWLTSTTAPSKSLSAVKKFAARIDVQMVGRFVQDQHVAVCRASRAPASAWRARRRKDWPTLVCALSAEKPKPPSWRAQFLHRERVAADAPSVSIGVSRAVQFLQLMLGEIAGHQLFGAHQFAAHRFQLARQQLRQGRFAVAVLAQQRDAVVGIEAQGQVCAAPACPAHSRPRRDPCVISGGLAGCALGKRIGAVCSSMRNVHRLQSFQHLDAALRLASPSTPWRGSGRRRPADACAAASCFLAKRHAQRSLRARPPRTCRSRRCRASACRVRDAAMNSAAVLSRSRSWLTISTVPR